MLCRVKLIELKIKTVSSMFCKMLYKPFQNNNKTIFFPEGGYYVNA